LVEDIDGVTVGPAADPEDPDEDDEEPDVELHAAASIATASSADPTRARVRTNPVTLPPDLVENRR
jgi:hypothetical protein